MQYFSTSSMDQLDSYTDVNWAGDRKTRESTSGGAVMIGQNLVKSWSKTQTLIATSSAESELYAAVKVTSESLGIMSLLQDLGYYPRCTVHADASAALGIIARRGLS